MKRVALAAALGLLLAGLAFVLKPAREHQRLTPAQPASTNVAPTATTPSPTTLPLSPSPATDPARVAAPLAEDSQRAVKDCLAQPAATWPELSKLLLRYANSGKAELQWRLARIEENGHELRVRVALETRESGATAYEAKVFSVDEEGLPEPLPPLPGQRENPRGWMSAYLRGKNLLSEITLHEITLPGGNTLRLEQENGQPVEAEFEVGGRILSCTGKSGEPRCRCS